MGDLEHNINELLKANHLDKAIILAEEELKKLSENKFHKILGKHLLTDEIVSEIKEVLTDFDQSTKRTLKKKQGFGKSLFSKNKESIPAAYMCEIHSFAEEGRIIYDFVSYKKMKSDSLEWLNDMDNIYDFFENNKINGLTEITDYLKNISDNERYNIPNMDESYEICEMIVLLRIIELFKEVYKDFILYEWGKIPMYVAGEENKLMFKVN